MSSNEPDQHVRIDKTVAAPPEVVWSMWTDPEHFAAWYGPTGARVAVTRMDVRVGGTRLLRMDVDTPNGARRMWFTGTYLEVVEHERLGYTDAIADEQGNVLPPEQTGAPAGHASMTEVHVELEPVGGGTRMVLTHLGIPAGSPGAAAWEMALDALVDHLSEGPVQ